MVEHVLPAHSPTVRLTMAQPEVHCTPLFCKTILQGGSPRLKLIFRVFEKKELTELGLAHNSGKEAKLVILIRVFSCFSISRDT